MALKLSSVLHLRDDAETSYLVDIETTLKKTGCCTNVRVLGRHSDVFRIQDEAETFG